MPRKRKIVVLSRFFEENVQLVANMCVQCYQQEDEVKVIGINRKFIDLIQSKRLEPLQKKSKLNENYEDNISFSTNSEELSPKDLDTSFEENSSNRVNFEELSSEFRNIKPLEDTELNDNSSSNLTDASNVSLEQNSSDFDENSNTISQGTCSIVENSSTNNSSAYLEHREETWDQIYEDTSSINSDVIANYSKATNIVEDNSVADNNSIVSNEVSFENIWKKSNDILEQSSQSFSDNCVDKSENSSPTNSFVANEEDENKFKNYDHSLDHSSCSLEHSAAKIEDSIPNNTYASLLQSSSELNLNNILNKINLNRKQYEDSFSASSEENFNFLEDYPAKTKCDNTSSLKNTTTTFSQSIFKTLNSKNSRLYDDCTTTNINSKQHLKPKSTSSFNNNVNKLQSTDCATMNNEEITSDNNDKRRVFSRKHNKDIKLVEKAKDDNIVEVIARVCNPIDILSSDKDNPNKERDPVRSETLIDGSSDDSMENLITHIRSSIKNESAGNNRPVNTIKEKNLNEKTNSITNKEERIEETSTINLQNVSEEINREHAYLIKDGNREKAKILVKEEEMEVNYCKNANSTGIFTGRIIGHDETNSGKPFSLQYKIKRALLSSVTSSEDKPEQQKCSQYFSTLQRGEDLISSATKHSTDIIPQSSLSASSTLPATQEKSKRKINFASLRNRFSPASSSQQDNVQN